MFKVAFRVDGNKIIGFGHVYRCIVFAHYLKENGFSPVFFCRYLHPVLKTKITSDFCLVELRSDNGLNLSRNGTYQDWLGISEELDASEFILASGKENFEFLIVDSYSLNQAWQINVSKKIPKICVLDDLANRLHSADFLINPSFNAKSNSYKKFVPDNCLVLAGHKYALLDSSFSFSLNFNKKYHLLINFGGADKDNYTKKVLLILKKVILKHSLRIKIIVGAGYEYLSQLQEYKNKYSDNMTIVANTNEMAREVSECMFAVGAGGGSLLERAALGVPSIVVSIAENQSTMGLEYERLGAGFFIKEILSDKGKAKLVSSVLSCIDIKKINRLSMVNRNIIDAKGLDRIFSNLVRAFHLLYFEKAVNLDCQFIFNCRYEKVNQFFYIDKNIPSYEEHTNWFKNSLLNCSIEHYIFKIGSKKIGYVRLDKKEEYYDLSIYISPGYRGFGFASFFLNKILEDFPTRQFSALVHMENKQSMKAFEKANFIVADTNYPFVNLRSK